jgi:hypothetical protein
MSTLNDRSHAGNFCFEDGEGIMWQISFGGGQALRMFGNAEFGDRNGSWPPIRGSDPGRTGLMRRHPWAT